ncbi:MAG: hypothetical protein ACUVSL_08325 [Chloroflexus sp.]|uniref:hypothetical protein n=1 Tax=Chloroflexus sp. TaxID=1904827 RepID=UPI00404B7C9F
MRLFKPMTDEQLARNDWVLAVVLTIGGIFLAWDFFRSAQQGIPALGLVGYLSGPIFAHKVSEILLLIMWIPVVWASNYEMSGTYPKLMPPERYLRRLRRLLFLAPVQMILATYAWTIVNLGTSPLTTDYQPLVFREDGWVWRYYLGALIIAGAAFVPVAMHKVMKLARQLL